MNIAKAVIGLYALAGVAAINYAVDAPSIAETIGEAFYGEAPEQEVQRVEKLRDRGNELGDKLKELGLFKS